ncbi:MAG: hypothetical protein ACRET2_06315, partial [Steroidobacteraceae bacterium]
FNDVREQRSAYPAQLAIGSDDDGDFGRVGAEAYNVDDAENDVRRINSRDGRAAETPEKEIGRKSPHRRKAHPDVMRVEASEKRFACRHVGSVQIPDHERATRVLRRRRRDPA